MTSTAGIAAPPAPPPVFLPPGRGTPIRMGALPVTLRVRAAQTGGAYVLSEQVLPPGVLVAPHTHHEQDQVSLVLAGSLGFLVGDQEFTAPPGSCVARPRGIPHAVWNPGPGEGTMAEITSPGGQMEEFFLAFHALTVAAGQPTAAAIADLAAPFGITYDQARIPGLEARYQVTAGGAWWAE